MDRLVKMGSGQGYKVETNGETIGLVYRHVQGYAATSISWWAYVRSDLAPDFRAIRDVDRTHQKDQQDQERRGDSVDGMLDPIRPVAMLCARSSGSPDV